MKKFTKPTKRIHPSPLPSPLSILPAALLALATSLSPQDQETLAYLLTCQKPNNPKNTKNNNNNNNQRRHPNHPPELGCSCFGCYKSFWVRWNDSVNRHIIHQIIDKYEETLEEKSKAKGSRKRRNGKNKKEGDEVVVVEEVHHDQDGVEIDEGEVDGVNDDDDDDEEEEEEEEDGEEKSFGRRFVSWVFGINE